MHKTVYTASPTASDFHNSLNKIRLLAGPIGGGKSVTCASDLMIWAQEQQPDRDGIRKTRFAVVRNTVDQLKTTTIKTIFDWYPPGIYGEYKIVDKTYHIKLNLPDGTRVESEWLFLSLDNPADTRKALSLELTGVWLNEAREIHPDVIEVMPTRTGRYPKEDRKNNYGCTRSGMIMDTNMPGADSWFGERMADPESSGWDVFIQPPAAVSVQEYLKVYGEDPLETFIDFDKREWVINPKADNLENLKADYYPTAISGKSKDFVDVYVLCRFGRDLGGRPVYEGSWVPDFHVIKEEVYPITSVAYPIIIGLDFGRTPSAIFIQSDPRGRTTVLSEVTTINCGIEKFITEYMKPHIQQRYPTCTFVVAPDPAGYSKQQIGEVSLVDIVKRMGFKVARPPSNDPSKRIAVVERILLRQIDGGPALRVHYGCKKIIQGFNDGYRYKVKRTGEMEEKPDKNAFSHPHDALQYGLAVLEVGAGYGMAQTRERHVELVDAGGWV